MRGYRLALGLAHYFFVPRDSTTNSINRAPLSAPETIFYLLSDSMSHHDEFQLFDLKVEVIAGDRPFMCSHVAGSFFLVQGENLIFENINRFSMYSLSALLPLLPAKQRPLHPNDWMTTDCDISCPDPHCGAKFRISRVASRTLRHSETSALPLPQSE